MRSIYKQILAVAVALIFSLALFLGIRVTMIPDVQKTVLSEVSIPISSETLPVVLLDAGHGGVDGGAVASNGVVEKDLNLAIALKVREQLTMLGFSVVMTRETDNSLEDDPGQTIRERKVSDMHNREEMAKQLGENTLFLSIHQNKYTASSSWGTQIFYGRHAEESRSLAEFLQDFLCTQLQPENKRKIKEGTEDIYLLYHLTCPAVLVECGFLSNGQDLENLTDPEYQSRYAFVLAMGLLQYYTQYAGPSEAIEADMEFGAAETENAGDGYIS